MGWRKKDAHERNMKTSEKEREKRRERGGEGRRGSCPGVHRCRSRLFILPVALTMSKKEKRRNRERRGRG